jgi:uncharacterized sporulation protein YeaH/YhbH (DUF444 family)
MKIRDMEQDPDLVHHLPSRSSSMGRLWTGGLYGYGDLLSFYSNPYPATNYTLSLHSLDELIERDKQREEDGFPRKIRLGRLVKPGKGEKGRIIVVPTTVEEKFVHDTREMEPEEEGEPSGGSGEGEEGEVIGEEPIHGADGEGTGAGQGSGGEHDIESNAYDLGRILTEKFELPNLQDKGKKRSLTRYTYDLTDRHEGAGQILDKKATLRKLVETNINLGNISGSGAIDSTGLLVSPRDRVYRVLSKEKDYESQAMVFFLRDYSGSMQGGPTEMIVNQHVLIYSWLLYQYDRQVETRFILHDEEAKEVRDFYTYFNLTVAGGTRVASAFKLVNEIVENESLARDYNIYIFYGTDGDDWDSNGSYLIPEIHRMLEYASRIGISIARTHPPGNSNGSTVERYLQNSRLLEEYPKLIRLDRIHENDSEERLIEGIRRMIS